MTIAHILDRSDRRIITCSPEHSVREAAQILAENDIGCLPVLENGEVAGLFSERDLLHRVAREGGAALERPVREMMTAQPLTIGRDTDVLTALSLMTHRRVRHLPVMEQGELVGFVSIGDLVKFRMDRIEHEAEQMREYITHG